MKGAPDGRCGEATIPGRMRIGDGVLKINGQVIREGTMGDLISVDRDGRQDTTSPRRPTTACSRSRRPSAGPARWVDRLDQGEA